MTVMLQGWGQCFEDEWLRLRGCACHGSGEVASILSGVNSAAFWYVLNDVLTREPQKGTELLFILY